MKHYTSIEQSNKLLELGLSPETADLCYHCYYVGDEDGDHPYYKLGEREKICKEKDCIPCWSVGALLEVMPKLGVYPTFDLDKENPSIFYLNDGTYQDEVVFGSTLLETAFNMVVWLLENNYIKKI